MKINMKRVFLAWLMVMFNNSLFAASVRLPGYGIYYPSPQIEFIAYGALASLGTIDATNEKVASCGRVFWESRTGTFAINKVGFRPGNVTDTGGSVTRVSLRDVQVSSAVPTQPDDTDDEFVDMTTASMASNVWQLSGALSADRTVSFNDWVCVVWAYNPTGRLSSDSFIINGLSLASGGNTNNYVNAVSSLTVAAKWTSLAAIPVIVFEDASGNSATFNGASTLNGITSANFTSGTTPDEKGNGFYLNFPATVDALYAFPAITAVGVGGTLALYEGTTLLQSVVISSRTLNAVGSGRVVLGSIPETNLTAGTTYYVSFFPNAGVNVQIQVTDWNKNVYKDLSVYGRNIGYSQRTDAGAWSVIESTRAAYIGVRFSKFSDGAGGAASGTKGWTYAN